MKTAFITGGSRGIGAATVAAFAEAGYRTGFLFEKEHSAAQAVCQATGALRFCADVADRAAVRDAITQFGPVDVLVCNAGVSHVGLINQVDEETWRRVFAVNVDGVYHAVCAALPGMLAKQSGCIITVSSMWGQVGASCEAAYSATKGAVIALTKALAKELGPSGIRVNCVAPGVILTDMCASVAPETLAEMAEDAPVGRNGTPEDVAKAMAYLADASFVTGEILAVNGGYVI